MDQKEQYFENKEHDTVLYSIHNNAGYALLNQLLYPLIACVGH